MIYILCIFVFLFNIIIIFTEGYNFNACLLAFSFNITTYSLFIVFLAGKTAISKPLINIKADIADDHNLIETIISRSKLIAKNSFMWFFLCCLPFAIYALTKKDLFNQISPITIFVITNSALTMVCLLVLSTIFLLYYEEMIAILISATALMLSLFIAFVPKTELNFIFLFTVVIIIACSVSYFLTRKNTILRLHKPQE